MPVLLGAGFAYKKYGDLHQQVLTLNEEMTQLKSTVRVFEYINLSGEYKLDNDIKGGTFSVDNMRFGLGAEYALNKNVFAASAIKYQHGFSQPAGRGASFSVEHFFV